MKKKALVVLAVAAVLYGVCGGTGSDNASSGTASKSTGTTTTYVYVHDDPDDSDAGGSSYEKTKQVCSHCGGTGKVERTGYAPNYGHNDTDTSYKYYEVCSVCGGTGYWD